MASTQTTVTFEYNGIIYGNKKQSALEKLIKNSHSLNM